MERKWESLREGEREREKGRYIPIYNSEKFEWTDFGESKIIDTEND